MSTSPFSSKELGLAVKIARTLVPGRRGPESFLAGSSAAKKLVRFLGDPNATRLVLTESDMQGGATTKDSVLVEIERKAFFSAWIQEHDCYPELLLTDTIEDAVYVRKDIQRKVSGGVVVVSIDEAQQHVEETIKAEGKPAAERIRTMLPVLEAPFKAMYIRTGSFIRMCHNESEVTAFALMINGSGYFSYPKHGQWQTYFSERGYLCVEPPGGVHAGQCRDTDLFAVFAPAKKRREPQRGSVTSFDLNFEPPAKVAPLYGDPSEDVYSYRLRLENGQSISRLPVGTYFVYDSDGPIGLGGDAVGGAKDTVIRQHDAVAWSGRPGVQDASLEMRCLGTCATVLAMCRQPLPG